MNPPKLITSVWGPKYVTWFRMACVQSLAWPKNRAALKGATWYIFTHQQDQHRIRSTINEMLPEVKVEFIDLPPTFYGTPGSMGQVMMRAIAYVTQECIKDKAPLLMAPPDTIFGDGTIMNMRLIGLYPGTCVAVPHPRVLNGILDKIGSTPLSNGQLVTEALRIFHRSWSDCDSTQPMINTLQSGVCWHPLPDNMIAINHMVPTVYLANMLDSDLAYFTTPREGPNDTQIEPHLGMWDWEWPGEHLIEAQRLRTVGSSDAAFMVEITDAHVNIPGVWPNAQGDPTKFHRDEKHNRHNRMNVSIFRGE